MARGKPVAIPNIDNINLKDIKLRSNGISPLDSQKNRQQSGTDNKSVHRASNYDFGKYSPNKYNSFDEYDDCISPSKFENESDCIESLF